MIYKIMIYVYKNKSLFVCVRALHVLHLVYLDIQASI